ncbi:MAG: hypothetical protein HOV80_03060 [Polyangiaceae bacterium]|nr:hypothetical protein [Polyangiaceae bacterium]
MKRFVQGFPFLMVAGVCMHVACGEADSGTDTTGVGPVGSQGSSFHPACNLDRRDGYCNARGQNPETCECLDCITWAMCTGKCVDDGTCNMGENAEDCSCADCNPGPNCVNANPDQGPGPDQGPAPASTTDTSTTDASTTGSPASTTDATTDASTTGSGMGGQGGA